MKRVIFALLAAAIAVGLFAPAANAASGDSARKKHHHSKQHHHKKKHVAKKKHHGTPNCMTKAEWNQIHNGQSRARVKQIVGTWGKVTDSTYYSDGTQDLSVEYRQCNRYGKPASSWDTVWISFGTETKYGKYVYDPYDDYVCSDYSDYCHWVGKTSWDPDAENGHTTTPLATYKGSWSTVY